MHWFTIFILIMVYIKTTKSNNFTLPQSDIIHASSGLILQYKSTYKPAHKILTLSVSIPLVADMCYLIPISSIRQIPRCNFTMDRLNFMHRNIAFRKPLPPRPPRVRTKRFLTDIVSIGIGTAALTLSTVNTVQIANLKSEMNLLSQSLRSFQTAENANSVGILHLNEGQLKLAQELNYTQQALSHTMLLTNSYSDSIRRHDQAIQTLESLTMQTNTKLDAFIHAVEGQLLHSSIDDILNHKLNLNFIHFDDMPKLIELVLEKSNIVLEEGSNSLSIIDLATKLLIQQQIHFVPLLSVKPSPFGAKIGNLIITSYFAAADLEEELFYVYETVPIPFKHGNKRVKLAQVPAYIGLRVGNKDFIQWSNKEATMCNFDFMSSCRETPAIRRDIENTCIFQIITDTKMSACHTESYTESTFIRKLGRYWIISTESNTTCHNVKLSEIDQHRIIDNHVIVLPSTAIYSNTDSNSLSCDKFYLPGLPAKVGQEVMLFHNQTMNTIDKELINLQSLIEGNTNWTKLPYIPFHIREIIEFISNTTRAPSTLFLGYVQHSTMFYLTIILAVIVVVLGTYQIYQCRSKKTKQPKIMIRLPTLKQLEQTDALKEIEQAPN